MWLMKLRIVSFPFSPIWRALEAPPQPVLAWQPEAQTPPALSTPVVSLFFTQFYT